MYQMVALIIGAPQHALRCPWGDLGSISFRGEALGRMWFSWVSSVWWVGISWRGMVQWLLQQGAQINGLADHHRAAAGAMQEQVQELAQVLLQVQKCVRSCYMGSCVCGCGL
jgi:hypothetical protein